MEDKKLKDEEVVVETIETPEIKEEIKPVEVEEQETEEIIEEVEQIDETVEITPVEETKKEPKKVQLQIAFDKEDIKLMLEALKEYTVLSKERKKRTNAIVRDNEAFNKKMDDNIKRADELRFLIKKEILIVDKNLEIFSIEDEGQVIGIETFIETEEGLVISEAKPITVGNTPEVKEQKQKPAKTSVQTVSEEL